MVKTWCLILQVVHVIILQRVLARIRLVPSHFSCLRDDWWEGLSEFALHQGKEGRKTGSLARISQISSETTGYEIQPECRSGGNKWSYVRSFILLRPGEGLTSNKHTVLTFLVDHKYNEVFRGVYFLTFREISFSFTNLKASNNTNYVVQIKPTRPAFTISGFPTSILCSFNSCSKLSYQKREKMEHESMGIITDWFSKTKCKESLSPMVSNVRTPFFSTSHAGIRALKWSPGPCVRPLSVSSEAI